MSLPAIYQRPLIYIISNFLTTSQCSIRNIWSHLLRCSKKWFFIDIVHGQMRNKMSQRISPGVVVLAISWVNEEVWWESGVRAILIIYIERLNSKIAFVTIFITCWVSRNLELNPGPPSLCRDHLANTEKVLYVSQSDILGPIDYLSDIKIWYRLKGLCLKITDWNIYIKYIYSYYLFQYHNLKYTCMFKPHGRCTIQI